jgi:hypothetical protein
MRRLGDRALTATEKQARRRENYWRMRAALEAIMACRSLGQARAVARDALAAVPANAKMEKV